VLQRSRSAIIWGAPVVGEVAAVTEVEEAIVAHLVRPSAPRTAVRPGRSGWASSTGGCGGPGADADSITVQRTRSFPTCQMHQIAYTDSEGIPMEVVVRTWRGTDGTWVVAPTGGGSPGPSRRRRPWANLTASSGVDCFTAGGRVEGAGSERAAQVRMTFADGRVLADVVEHGIVLFFEPRSMAFPADVEILDGGGSVLAGYREFDGSPFTG
jgi:hypothetical protein